MEIGRDRRRAGRPHPQTGICPISARRDRRRREPPSRPQTGFAVLARGAIDAARAALSLQTGSALLERGWIDAASVQCAPARAQLVPQHGVGLVDQHPRIFAATGAALGRSHWACRDGCGRSPNRPRWRKRTLCDFARRTSRSVRVGSFSRSSGAPSGRGDAPVFPPAVLIAEICAL